MSVLWDSTFNLPYSRSVITDSTKRRQTENIFLIASLLSLFRCFLLVVILKGMQYHSYLHRTVLFYIISHFRGAVKDMGAWRLRVNAVSAYIRDLRIYGLGYSQSPRANLIEILTER